MPRHNSLERGWRMSVGGPAISGRSSVSSPTVKSRWHRSNRYSRRHGVASPVRARLGARDPHRHRDGSPIARDQLEGVRWRSQVRSLVRRGISWNIPSLSVVAAKSSLRNVRVWDRDGPGFPASDELVRRPGKPSTALSPLRGSPAGAGGGLCPRDPPNGNKNHDGSDKLLWYNDIHMLSLWLSPFHTHF